jgi:hypothetical protein
MALVNHFTATNTRAVKLQCGPSIITIIITALQPWLGLSSCYTQSVGLLGRGISPSEGRYRHTTQNKHTDTPTPRVGFEPTVPVFEQANTVHAFGRLDTAMGTNLQQPFDSY